MDLFPHALAADVPELAKIKLHILDPIVELLFTLAVIYFLYGLVKFLWNFDNQTAKTEGKRHMIWGIVGIAIMVSVFGLLNLVMDTVNRIAG
jgi:uncharacterized membrane protein YidH (DUF202 family)